MEALEKGSIDMRRNSQLLIPVCALLSVAACVTEGSSTELSKAGAVYAAPIAVNLIFAGASDGGESVVRHHGLVRYQARSAPPPPDLSVDIPIPAGTVVDREYVALRLRDIVNLWYGLGYGMELVCLERLCAS